jgi:hypothetical protein
VVRFAMRVCRSESLREKCVPREETTPAAARRADRASVGGATPLATPRSAHRGPRGAAGAGATPAIRNRGSVPGRSRIRRRLLRALRRAKRGVGVRRRFSSRSAFSLALLRLLDENRPQTAALSALSMGGKAGQGPRTGIMLTRDGPNVSYRHLV